MQKFQRWILLVTVGAGLLLITLDNSILYTALPTLSEQLNASGSQSLWIINAYPLVMAGFLLGSGTLGDRIDHRRMFLIGLVVFGLASLLAAFAPTAEVLIIGRIVLAIGAAAMMPATLALIRITFDDERERNIAMAIWGSLAVVGAALGPVVSGLLLEHFWWGSVFLINVPVVIAALISTLLIAPPNLPNPSKKWDLISSLYAMLTLASAVFFIKELAHTPQNWWMIAASLIAALVGARLFVHRQSILEVPLLDFQIFRNRVFSAGVLTAAFAMFAIAGVQLVTTQRFQLVEGFTPLQAGILVASVAIGSLPTALLGGTFLHRTGLFPLIAGGLGLAACGTVIVILGAQLDSLVVLVCGLLITGAGLGGAMSVASIAIMSNAPPHRAGMASSVGEVSYEFGSLTAVAVLGSLVTFVYSMSLNLPQGADPAARESLSDALAIAQGRQDLIEAAQAAYNNGFLVTITFLAVTLAFGAILLGRLLLQDKRQASAKQPSA